MTTGKLTPKMQAFVREYLIDLAPAAAARRAGYSAHTANRTAYELMQKPQIQELIQSAMADRTARVQDTADEVLREIIATGREARAAGKFDAAMRALELRGRHQGMFKDKLEVAGVVAIFKDYTGRKDDADR